MKLEEVKEVLKKSICNVLVVQGDIEDDLKEFYKKQYKNI